jgi:hypothetical protein
MKKEGKIGKKDRSSLSNQSIKKGITNIQDG